MEALLTPISVDRARIPLESMVSAMNDDLMEEFARTNCSLETPSRYLMVEVGLLRNTFLTICSINARYSVLYFEDLWEAINFVKETRAKSDQQDVALATCLFLCPSLFPVDAVEARPTSLTFILDLTAFTETTKLCQVVNRAKKSISEISSCQISTQSFVDTRNGRVVKFFVDFYDSRAMPHILRSLHQLYLEPVALLRWEFCTICLEDRKHLFGPVSENLGTSPTTPQTPDSSLFTCCASSQSSNSSSPKHTTDFEIDIGLVEANIDTRTTCMIRNIPNKYTQQMLIDLIDETHLREYDFIYLRMDFKNKCNVGYAFINFIDPKFIVTFGRRLMGKRWPRFNSDKICHLTYARIQGKRALVDKFRHSRVMMEPSNYQPKVYHSDGDLRGYEETFPL